MTSKGLLYWDHTPNGATTTNNSTAQWWLDIPYIRSQGIAWPQKNAITKQKQVLISEWTSLSEPSEMITDQEKIKDAGRSKISSLSRSDPMPRWDCVSQQDTQLFFLLPAASSSRRQWNLVETCLGQTYILVYQAQDNTRYDTSKILETKMSSRELRSSKKSSVMTFNTAKNTLFKLGNISIHKNIYRKTKIQFLSWRYLCLYGTKS